MMLFLYTGKLTEINVKIRVWVKVGLEIKHTICENYLLLSKVFWQEKDIVSCELLF